MESSGVAIGTELLTSWGYLNNNNYFKEAYEVGGAGTYTGSQLGTWTKN